MADPPSFPDVSDDTGVGPERGATARTSRWQKAVGIIGLVVVLWVGSETYEVLYGDIGDGGPGGPGGGNHGPGQDTPVENQDQEIDTEDDGGHTPPAGGDG